MTSRWPRRQQQQQQQQPPSVAAQMLAEKHRAEREQLLRSLLLRGGESREGRQVLLALLDQVTATAATAGSTEPPFPLSRTTWGEHLEEATSNDTGWELNGVPTCAESPLPTKLEPSFTSPNSVAMMGDAVSRGRSWSSDRASTLTSNVLSEQRSIRPCNVASPQNNWGRKRPYGATVCKERESEHVLEVSVSDNDCSGDITYTARLAETNPAATQEKSPSSRGVEVAVAPPGSPWTDFEREAFHRALHIHGRNWKEIAKHVPTRTVGACVGYYKRHYRYHLSTKPSLQLRQIFQHHVQQDTDDSYDPYCRRQHQNDQPSSFEYTR